MKAVVFETMRIENMTSIQLYEVLKLRSDVFVVEQTCVYPDLDNKDLHKQAIHLIAKTSKNSIVAYARCLPPNLSYTGSSIGRVVVNSVHRGKGIATTLMNEAIKICLVNWPNVSIMIGAQLHLESFYNGLGFVSFSPPYDEDGIMHIDMKLVPNSTI